MARRDDKNEEFDIDYYKKKFPNDNGFRDKRFSETIVIGDNLKTAITNIKTELDNKDSRDKQIAKALEILSCCHPSWSADGKKRTGLVVGKVQSGKTTSFTLLTAAAADNGYRLVIHLLGTTTSLLDSNLKDVKYYLGLNDRNNKWFATGIAPGGVKLNVSGAQLAAILKGNPHARNKEKKVVYISLLKQRDHIQFLTKTLQAAKLNTFPMLNTLIIDDEVDSYTPDISKTKEPPSSINRHLKGLRDVAGTCTYVGYTATSAAIKLSHQTNFICPDFHSLLHPGKGYIGNEQIFGKPDRWLEESQSLKWKDTKTIKELKITQKIDITSKNKKPKYIDDEISLKQSMKRPVCDFLISQEILGERWADPSKKKTFSMMLVPSLLAKASRAGELNHTDVEYELNKFLGHKLYADIANNKKTSSTYKILKEIYDDKKVNCNKKDLKTFPTFKKIIKRLEQIFDPNNNGRGSLYTVATLNQTTENEINFDASEIWFIIGGAKLSRGFVVKNLLTTWMPLSPNKHVLDTMQQRGRFFGYKHDYLDLISVYLKRETIDNFRNYMVYERQQWRELEESRTLGIPLPDSDASYVGAAGLHSLTSATKTKRKYFNIFKRGWCAAHHLSFDDNNGRPIKNMAFHNHLDSYINGLEKAKVLKLTPQKNRYNATTPVQRFKSCRATVDLVSRTLLKPLLDPSIGLTDNDDRFRDCIKHIDDLDKNTKCDVILFDGGLSRRFYKKDPKENYKEHTWQQNYATGPGASRKNLKGSNAYCGDNRVLLHKNIDPLAEYINTEKNNHNLTVQIHKMDGHDVNKNKLLKDLYAIRILLPRFPT